MKREIFIFLSLIWFQTASKVNAQSVNPTYFYAVQGDQQPFMFNPVNISPLQTGALGEVMTQFSDHYLSNLSQNPATIKDIPAAGYGFLNIRTLGQNNFRNERVYCDFCYDSYRNIIQPNAADQLGQEPIVSAAFFIAPVEGSSFRLGLTYQWLRSQEDFYRLGSYGFADFTIRGIQADEKNSEIFKVADNMDKSGHFPALYAGFQLNENLSVGLKAAYSSYRASGSQAADGYGYFLIGVFASTGQGDRLANRVVSADYNHWDISTGIAIKLNERSNVGFKVGFLDGTFSQIAQRQYLFEERNRPSSESKFTNLLREDFMNEGTKIYASGTYRYQPGSQFRLQLNYQVSWTDQRVDFGLSDYSVNFSESRHLLENGINRYSNSYYLNNREAVGRGNADSWRHQIALSLQKKLFWGFQIETGFQYRFDHNQERVIALEDWSYIQEAGVNAGEERNDYSYITDLFYGTQINQLVYDFSTWVPLILQKSLGKSFSVEAGGVIQYDYTVFEYRGARQSQRLDVDIVDNVVSTDLDTNNEPLDGYYHNFGEYWVNGLASVSYRPGDQINFRFMAFTDRQSFSFNRDIDSFRFQLTAEYKF